jgi:hypothetical protein
MNQNNSIVISFRLDRRVRNILEKENLEPAKEARIALEDLAKRVEFKKAMTELTSFIERRVKPSKKGFAVSVVRSDRNEMH